MVYIKKVKSNERRKWTGDAIEIQVVIGNLNAPHIIRGNGEVTGPIEKSKISLKNLKKLRGAIELEVINVCRRIMLEYGLYWDKKKNKLGG